MGLPSQEEAKDKVMEIAMSVTIKGFEGGNENCWGYNIVFVNDFFLTYIFTSEIVL